MGGHDEDRLFRIQTLLVALANSLMCAPAAAQGRIFLPTLPDLDLAGLVAPEWHDGEELNLEFTGRGETWLDLGRTEETRGRYALTGAAGAGWRPNQLTLLMARGEATGSGDYEGADPSSSLRGWHRLFARTGFGDPGSDPLGIDITGGYNALHSGRDGWALPPSDLAWGENFSDERVEIGLWPRTGEDDEWTGVLPMRYALRKVSYPRGGGPVGGFTTHELSSGIGFRSYDREFVSGWWEIVGITYSRTSFSAPAGAADASTSTLTAALETPRALTHRSSLPSHERLDWRLLGFDHIVLADSDFILGSYWKMGAAWLWDSDRDIDYALFTYALGVRAKFTDGEVGFGMSRDALATPDGQRFTEAFRVEGMVEVLPEDTGIGAGVRAGFHQFGSQERGPDPTRSGAIHSRWFLAPTSWSKLGTYHLAHYGARVEGNLYDPIHYTNTWSHEVGMFLELNDAL